MGRSFDFCRKMRSLKFALLLVAAGITGLGHVSPVAAQDSANRLVSVSVEEDGPSPEVLIETEKPVGYRYTVYDSYDPVRVVVDFPNLETGDLQSPIPVESDGVKEIRISSFDLSAGKLSRVEILLEKAIEYEVDLSETSFRVKFVGAASEQQATQKPQEQKNEKAADADDASVAEEASKQDTREQQVGKAEAGGKPKTESGSAASAPAASKVREVEIQDGSATLVADGRIQEHRYFTLGAPPRIVVDVYGVKAGFPDRSLEISQKIKQMRVGTYDDKVRFVFDAEGKKVPEHAVLERENSIVVTWGDKAEGVPETARIAAAKSEPVTVEEVAFDSEDGTSILSVVLSEAAETIEPVKGEGKLRLGVRNALIARSLRRVIDPSSFPSAVRQVTPYTVQKPYGQDVLFAVDLKGPVPYSFETVGNVMRLEVEDGPFAEPAPRPETREVAVEAAPEPRADETTPKKPAALEESAKAKPEGGKATAAPQLQMVEEPARYTGEPITLIFDDADIRRIFQLIADVSDLNLIVSDEVEGSITLRLIDVPWDQALDLVLDIKNLGMIKEGNVVRVLPKAQLREMRQAELTAVQQERELEPLETEVVSVSYTDLGNVAGPARELLTDRGKITEDSRNKQLIVTDIPSVIEEVRKLVGILDTPERQVMIEARIVEADSTSSLDLGINWGVTYRKTDTGTTNISSGDIGLGGSFVIPPSGAASGSTAGFGTSLTFGELGIDSTVLDLQLSALETSGHGKVVSKPRVTTLNGQTATISQGTKIPYQSVSDQGTQTEFVDAVLSLDVTPVINPDDTVILEIQASNSSPGSTVSTGAGSAPAIDTKEANTKVLVEDGDTTVIGGIFVENEDSSVVGVPLLMHIPYLGNLFKSTRKSKSRNELLVFITPRILE